VSGGLFALLDDIVAIAKLAAASLDDVTAAAAKASSKAAGVVIDDTAVTPRYVHGFSPERELPVVKRIAAGSLRNKLLIILPVILLLSQFLPLVLSAVLMVGGAYLCYEGAEKVWEKLSGHTHGHGEESVVGGPDEEKMVAGAIRTDLILSAEIMVISLNEVAGYPLLARTAIMVMVALMMTALVYGVVALIVKMDDLGLHLATEKTGWQEKLGHRLVNAMPGVLRALSTIGIIAMLWVGGHILLAGFNDLGWHAPYEWVHHIEETITHAIPGFIGALLAWVFNTAVSLVIGLIAGGILVAVMQLIQRIRGGGHNDGHETGPVAHTVEDAAGTGSAAESVLTEPAETGSSADPADEGTVSTENVNPDAGAETTATEHGVGPEPEQGTSEKKTPADPPARPASGTP